MIQLTHTYISVYIYIYIHILFKNSFSVITIGYIFYRLIDFYFPAAGVFVAARGISLVAKSRGSSLVVVCGFLIVVASLVMEHGL